VIAGNYLKQKAMPSGLAFLRLGVCPLLVVVSDKNLPDAWDEIERWYILLIDTLWRVRWRQNLD